MQPPFVPVYGDGVFLAGDGYIAPLPGDPAPNALEVMAWPSMTEPCGEETLPWTTYHTAAPGARPVIVLRFPRALMLLISAQALVTSAALALAALAAARSRGKP